jgi:hypothetical protein
VKKLMFVLGIMVVLAILLSVTAVFADDSTVLNYGDVHQTWNAVNGPGSWADNVAASKNGVDPLGQLIKGYKLANDLIPGQVGK